MERWHNRIAVVTGASAGIGAACCKYLVRNGMIVVGLARRKDRVIELRNELSHDDERKRLHAIQCDVRKEEDICQAFAEIEKLYGPISVLVNNAGILRETELVRENNTADLRDVLDTNVMGVALCTREAFRSMKKNIDGHVFLINSIAGHKVNFTLDWSRNIYPPSKYAITAMSEVYRQEFQMFNTKIKVTSISPGVVNTDIITEKMLKSGSYQVFLEPEDIADALIYCLQTAPHVQIHELIIKPMGEKL